MDDLIEFLEKSIKWPSMCFIDFNFDMVASFVNGYFLCIDKNYRVEFKNWLVSSKNGSNELGWERSILHILYPERVNFLDLKNDPIDDKLAVKFLIELLKEWRNSKVI